MPSKANSRPAPKLAAPLSPRGLALRVLLLQEESRRPVDQLLSRQWQQQMPTDARDRQLAMAMVYGVLRWRGMVDEVVSHYSRHPRAKMKPLTLAALRLGIFQLLFLDRIPASAAIDETIKALAAAHQPRWLLGFVNGLLRTVARDHAKMGLELFLSSCLAAPAPGPQSDSVLARASEVSHPAWLRQRWQGRYGRELTTKVCQINNQQPPLVLRVNLCRTTVAQFQAILEQAGIEAFAGLYAPAALVLPADHFSGRIEELPGYNEGYFTVQDEAAQLVSLLLAESGPGRWLDACAGVGGKSTHLAELLSPQAELTALEPQAARFTLLQENLARLGAGRVRALPQKLEGWSGDKFRAILVDAPCSGLGVVRRQPDIRWNRTADELPLYQEKQLTLLRAAAPLLSSGGVLVYAVCSHEPEENEEVVARLLALHPELSVEDAASCLPEAARSLVEPSGFYRSLPSSGLDGFFAARLRKT